jgi:hypothetical protein
MTETRETGRRRCSRKCERRWDETCASDLMMLENTGRVSVFGRGDCQGLDM